MCYVYVILSGRFVLQYMTYVQVSDHHQHPNFLHILLLLQFYHDYYVACMLYFVCTCMYICTKINNNGKVVAERSTLLQAGAHNPLQV